MKSGITITVLERHARSTCIERLPVLAESDPHNLLTVRRDVRVQVNGMPYRAGKMLFRRQLAAFQPSPPEQLAEQQGRHVAVVRPGLYHHTTVTPKYSHPIGPCPSHHSVRLVPSFGKWNVFAADLRKGLVLYGRVVQHGDSRRALRLALELVLALRTHGWIDLRTTRRRRRASDDQQQSVEFGGSFDEQCSGHLVEQSLKPGDSVDNGDVNGQRAHGFDNLLTHRLLDSTAFMRQWKYRGRRTRRRCIPRWIWYILEYGMRPGLEWYNVLRWFWCSRSVRVVARIMVLSRGSNVCRYVGTNGGGIYACFRGCSSRIGCFAFTYTGTINAATPATAGAGRC